MTMATKPGLLVEKLQKIYNRAQSYNSPRSFFLTLYEFMDEYNSNPILAPIVKRLDELVIEENKDLNKLQNDALEQMQKVYSQIDSYVKEKYITHPSILGDLEHYIAFNEGRIQSTNGSIAGRYGNLSHALMLLDQDKNHRNFTNNFGERNESEEIEKWTFSPAFEIWEEAKNYIDRIKLTKLWYSWDRIVYFYGIYRDYEKMKKELWEKERLMDVLNLNIIFGELNDIMNSNEDPKRYLREFDVINYKIFLERIFDFTKEVLLLTDEELTKQVAKQQWTYDPTLGIFYIDKTLIKLKKNNFRAKLLELLTKTDESKHKIWSWDEIYKEIERIDDMGTKEKHKVYDACKGLAEIIATKSGINDFLIYDTNTVCINPSYLTKA